MRQIRVVSEIVDANQHEGSLPGLHRQITAELALVPSKSDNIRFKRRTFLRIVYACLAWQMPEASRIVVEVSAQAVLSRHGKVLVHVAFDARSQTRHAYQHAVRHSWAAAGERGTV